MSTMNEDRPPVKPDPYASAFAKLAAIEAAEDVVRREGYGPPPTSFTITDIDEQEEEIARHLQDRKPVADYDDDDWQPSQPTDAEVAEFYAWRARCDAREAIERPGFRATLASVAELLGDSDNVHARAIGAHLGLVHKDASRVEATSWEQMEERLDAERDSLGWRAPYDERGEYR